MPQYSTLFYDVSFVRRALDWPSQKRQSTSEKIEKLKKRETHKNEYFNKNQTH